MRAVVFRDGTIVVDDVPEPPLGEGQLRVRPLATGICGSDLSAKEHTDDFLQWNRDIGETGTAFDPTRDVVFGHEFTSEVIEVGPGTTAHRVGDRIVTLPHVVAPDGVRYTIGYSNDYPGALAERIVVDAAGHLPIPDGVSPIDAAVTEPMATGVNGVLRSGIGVPDGAIVVGCGPVGLGAVVELASRGIAPIVASDPSAVRRSAALALGADIAVDPLADDPVDAWRAAASPGQRLHVIEASGRKGMINELFYRVPDFTRISVVGVCTSDDVIRPGVGISRNIGLEFVGGPGYRDEAYHAFALMLRHIARGRVDLSAVVTGYTGRR